MRRSIVVAAPLVVGAALLALTVARTHLTDDITSGLGLVLLMALLPSAGWHLLRTIAWRQCFPRELRPSFARIFRVRLAAEAFSFVTIRGVAGEPLKVVLLERDVAPAVAAAAVALERAVYLLITAVIVGLAAVVALLTLPLTRTWMNIFAGVAAAATTMVVLTAVLFAWRTASARAAPAACGRPPSAFARFVRQLDVQLRDLIHGDRRRLIGLLVLEALASVMMALEVWAVLWLTPTPIRLVGAMAVETFTRVASVASAFIPANLGALEASNIVAATAVNAAGGAATLALARRLRGIVWCAGGLLIYPRPRGAQPVATNVAPAPTDPQRQVSKDRDGNRTLVVIENPCPAVRITDRLGGLPIGERMLRASARARYTRVLVWTPDQRAQWMALASRLAAAPDVVAVSDEGVWQSHVAKLNPGAVMAIVAPGIVPSPALLERARELAPDSERPLVGVAGHDSPHTGMFRARPDCLARPAMLARTLTRSGREAPAAPSAPGEPAPLSLDVSTRMELAAAERRLRHSIFKPTDGRLGRFNRRISIPISVALIRWTRFSANAMSAFIIALGLYAAWLFSRGEYGSGVLAALVSLAASVLDGCDGELARLQYTDSPFGCWLDTLGDYLYYVAVFIGLTIGAVHQTGWRSFWWLGGALLAGMLLTFGLLILLRGRITNGQPEQLRTTTKAHYYGTGKRWARVAARLSTVAMRATMPYGILGFALLGLLPAVLVLGAIGAQIYWISIAVELKRLLKGSARSVAKSVEPAF
jgi:phosphatidylglycerophosphate synthase